MSESMMAAWRQALSQNRQPVRWVVSRRVVYRLARETGLPIPKGDELRILGFPATLDDVAADGFGLVVV